MDVVSDSTFARTFRKLPLDEFWCSTKNIRNYLKWLLKHSLLPFPRTHLWEAKLSFTKICFNRLTREAKMGVSYFFSTKPDVKEFYKNIIAIHLSLFLVWKTLPKAQATWLVFWYFTIFYPPLMVWQAEGMWPPNDIHILTSGTEEWYRSQQGFCRCNEMGQLCWISRISPKCYHKCLLEREAEEDLTPRGEKATWPWRPWSDAAAARECWWPPELEEARNRGLPPELPEGAQSCQHPDFSPVILMLDF